MSSQRENAFVSVEQMQNAIIGKAIKDEEFRANLLADPKSAIYDELGINLPEAFDISVHESKGTSLHIALPPDVSDLSEGQLEAMAGGQHIV